MKMLVLALLMFVSTACLTIQTPPPVVVCCAQCSGGAGSPIADPDPDPIDPCPPCSYLIASTKHVGTLGPKAKGVTYPISAGELKLLWTDSSGNVQSDTFALSASTGMPGADVTQKVLGAPASGVTKAWTRWKGSNGVWTDFVAKSVKD